MHEGADFFSLAFQLTSQLIDIVENLVVERGKSKMWIMAIGIQQQKKAHSIVKPRLQNQRLVQRSEQSFLLHMMLKS